MGFMFWSFSFIYFFSFLLSVFCSSVYGFWFVLELNMFVFLGLVCLMGGFLSLESSMKYFILQSFFSLIILFSLILDFSFGFYIFIICLFGKLGGSVMFFWVPSVSFSLDFFSFYLLLGLQKFLPFIFFNIFLFNFYGLGYLGFMIFNFIFSLVLGGYMGFVYVGNLRGVLVFSSLSHLGWLGFSLLLGVDFFLSYFMVYLLFLFILIYLSSIYGSFNLLEGGFIYFLVFFSFMGVPPFFMFWFKVFIFFSLFNLGLSLFLLVVLFLASIFSFFMYFKLFLSNFFSLSELGRKGVFWVVFIFNLLGLVLIFL
uniref:NADH-ubiquinone oxidoreductase chain 2 n=1 Tax=Seison sp. MS-2015 TaxID=1673261 RepID=A0A678NZ04_9BILA|nr:NADH dehydrogenase subunit 2 [Seison sp. MS-2015]